MKTFLEILIEIAEQKWSIEDPDIPNIEELEEDNPALKIACQQANSFIFRANDLPFKDYKKSFLTVAEQKAYPSPIGNVYRVTCDGNTFDLTYDKYLDRLKPDIDRPSKWNREILNGEDNIILYPTPDDIYSINVYYETLNCAKRQQGDEWVEITNLERDDDILNIPQQFEDLYLKCLYPKTMVYLTIDDTDENYQPYEKSFQEALLVLKNALGIKKDKIIGF